MDPRPAAAVPPWVFMVLIVPFGLVSGFPSVALAYQLNQAGVGSEAIAGLIALGYLPHTWKFLWAPVLDLVWTRRGWYLASSALTAAGIAAMGWWGADGRHLSLLWAVMLLANFTSTGVGMAVESLMAHTVADEQKGRAAGWFQAGNLGGLGLGGGLALWLIQDQGTSVAASGCVLAALGLACALPLVRVAEPTHAPGRDRQGFHFAAHLRTLWRDLWAVMRSRTGYLAMAMCFLPIGSGAASNLWSVLASDWSASANTVAVVNGVMGGLVTAIGCVAGGFICDRIDRRTAYCLFGAVQAALAVAMSLAPQTELMFIVFANAYGFALGMAYAGFSAVVLEAIGRGAAATKYNLLASLSNVPVAYVTYLDGVAHARWGAPAMLQLEAAIGMTGMLVFAAIALGSRRAEGARL